MTSTPSDGGEENEVSEAEWLDRIADMAEAFVGNTLETISSIESLTPEAHASDLRQKQLVELKKRIETLDALLIEARELSAKVSERNGG